MGFKQEVRKVGLSLEMGTDGVPDDGRFHIVREGTVIASYRRKTDALTAYRAMRDELLAETGATIKSQPDVADALRRQMGETEYKGFKQGNSGTPRQKLRVGGRRGHR